jgi:transcriptional regulator with XRE-family HTH domain
MNPIKAYRSEYHLSQRDLASLCGITEQVVLKAEQGVFPTMPPSLLEGLNTLTGDSKDNIEKSYEDWISRELRSVELPDISHDNLVRDFILFKDRYLPTICKLNNIPVTISSFCALMKIHPYVLQKYISGKMKETPRQLLERIYYIRATKER